MMWTLFFYPLDSQVQRLVPNWCSLDIDEQVAPGGQITGSSLRILISRHGAFRVPPPELELVLHSVSSDEYKDLCSSIIGIHSSIDLVRIKAAPQIHSFNIVSLSSCQLIIAIHSPIPVKATSTSRSLPTLQTTPQAQLPTLVRLPQLAEERLMLSDIEQLLPSVLIHVHGKSVQSINIEDCRSNSVQTPADPIPPSCPEWVTSFTREMSRRREIPTVGFHSLLHLAWRLDNAILARLICTYFVINDGIPINTSMGKNIRSCSFEYAGLQTTLSSPATQWTESKVRELFTHNFGGNGSHRHHMGTQQLTLIGNEVLPWGLGVPVTSTASAAQMIWYQFKPTVALLRGAEPYFLLEFESQSNDFQRLLLYGSSLVRWISRVSTYRCILPLCLVRRNGETRLLYMYELNNKIQYVQKTFGLNSLQSRLEFFVTILNITDREPIQGLHETLTQTIHYLRKAVPKTEFSTVLANNNNKDKVDDIGMSVSKGKDDVNVVHENAGGGVQRTGQGRKEGRKRKGPYDCSRGLERGGGPKDDDSGGSAGAGDRRSGGGGGSGQSVTRTSAQKNSEQNKGVSTRSQTKDKKWAVGARAVQDILIRAGYITVTETDTGKEDIISVSKKTKKFTVKVVRSDNEKQFFGRQIVHPNIIEPEEVINASEVISSCDWHLVILPKLVSLTLALDAQSSAVRKLQDMSYDLASGLHFLHSSGIGRLDIKPDNLAYHHKTFVLQIIDFSTVVTMGCLDPKLPGKEGRLLWMAPEMLRTIPSNPIATDRYSCGVVFTQLAEIIDVAGVKDHRWVELKSFATQLMNADPGLRPSLEQYANSS